MRISSFRRPQLPLPLLPTLLLALSTVSVPTGAALAAPGEVLDEVEIGDATGGFGGTLSDDDRFGSAVAPLGDLDGDGVGDLAVGAVFDDDGGTDRGAVWVLFLNADGTVKSEQKISDTDGGFGGVLADDDNFGASVASLGDLDGDGLTDLAVGAPLDDDGGTNRGSIWVLFLDSDGTVKSEQKISDTVGGFGGTLADNDLFGCSLALLDDLDGDGIDDLATGAIGDNDGGPIQGAVWVLFMDTDGTVKSEQKISDTAGGFVGPLAFFDRFGWAVTSLDDLDGDGIDDLAVGAATLSGGAIWILFLDTDGTVQGEQKIDDTTGGFAGAPGNLGWSLSLVGDVNGDGQRDLAAGAAIDDDGGTDRGAVWLLFLAQSGLVVGEEKISSTSGGFTGPLADGDEFGFSVAYLGSGASDLAVGAYKTDGGGSDRGAIWLLEVEGTPLPVPALQGPALLALVACLGALGSRFTSRRRLA